MHFYPAARGAIAALSGVIRRKNIEKSDGEEMVCNREIPMR
jgi:hypothetical protein